MNISIDIRALADDHQTGVGEYTKNLLTALFKIDQTNQYFLFYNSFKKKNFPEFNQANIKIINFRIPSKLLKISLPLFHQPKIDQLINRQCQTKIDLFFFPNLNYFATACPYIITAHDLSFEFYPEFYSGKSRLWHSLINPRRKFSQARKIIAVSESTRQDLIKTYKIAPEKAATIHSGLAEEFRPLAQTDPRLALIKNKYHLPENFILYLGTVEARKNILGLIQAFNEFKKKDRADYALVIAGKPGFGFKQILNAAKQSSSAGKIIFTDYIDAADKVFLYNLAKIFAYPSFYEGFGFPALEAMKCGAPTVASAASSLPEVLETGAILVNPYNVNELAFAMEQFATNENLRRRYSILGQEQAAKFSWTVTAERVLKCFND
jgi:glycosyltransferase involved in cell wall biosynthesis